MGGVPEGILSSAERAILGNLLSEILPSSSGAGAREAGAAEYVIRRLGGPDSGWVAVLRKELAEAAGREASHVARLAAATDEDRAAFFGRLRSWAWEGLLCDPAHGGNLNEVGWLRFGFPGPPKRRGYRREQR
jgi:gluconate 2-dehydrogenase alpha chain